VTYEVVDETPDRSDGPADGKHTDITELVHHLRVFTSEIGCRKKLFSSDTLEEHLLVLGTARVRLLVLAGSGRRLVVVEFLGDFGTEPSLEVRESDLGERVGDLPRERVGDELTFELVSVDNE
jgi:hypothetical protein